MRTKEDIMSGLHIYYAIDSKRVFLIQDNYSHSLKLIKWTLEYAKEIGLTVPDDDDIDIEILKGERFARVMSIEFNSSTKPNLIEGKQYYELTKDSGLWDWLKY